MDQIDTIIYHEVAEGIPCPDGLAAAWVARKKYPTADILGLTYGCTPENFPQFPEGSHLLLLDLSFPVETLKLWKDRGIEVTIIDHHLTAINKHRLDQVESLKLFWEIEESGATLTWKVLFPDKPMPAFLRLVRDRDVKVWTRTKGWNKFWKAGGTIYHCGTGVLGRDFELYDRLESMNIKEVIRFLRPIAQPVIEKKQVASHEIINKAQIVFWNIQDSFYRVAFFPNEKKSNISEVGRFVQDFYPVDFALFCTGPGKYDLRSRTTNVRKIAEFLGSAYGGSGGGHDAAAGFQLPYHKIVCEKKQLTVAMEN